MLGGTERSIYFFYLTFFILDIFLLGQMNVNIYIHILSFIIINSKSIFFAYIRLHFFICLVYVICIYIHKHIISTALYSFLDNKKCRWNGEVYLFSFLRILNLYFLVCSVDKLRIYMLYAYTYINISKNYFCTVSLMLINGGWSREVYLRSVWFLFYVFTA